MSWLGAHGSGHVVVSGQTDSDGSPTAPRSNGAIQHEESVSQVLSAEQKRIFARDGVVFPIRVLSLEEAATCRVACDALEESLGGKPRTIEVRQMHLHFAWAYQLASHPAILDAVEDLLGPNLVVWATELFAKHPRDTNVSIAWHRDGAYMGLDSERTLTAWLALTESCPDNGGMQVACETNRREYLHLDGSAARVTGKKIDNPPAESVCSVELRPGEMSLHDVHVLHGSGPNRSDRKRVGFAIRFTAPDARPIQERPPAALVRGEDRYGYFDLRPQPEEVSCDQSLNDLRHSARRHLDATLKNLKLAGRRETLSTAR